jgi:hypothetical protein
METLRSRTDRGSAIYGEAGRTNELQKRQLIITVEIVVKCQHGIAEADDTQICENTMRC